MSKSVSSYSHTYYDVNGSFGVVKCHFDVHNVTMRNVNINMIE